MTIFMCVAGTEYRDFEVGTKHTGNVCEVSHRGRIKVLGESVSKIEFLSSCCGNQTNRGREKVQEKCKEKMQRLNLGIFQRCCKV